MIAPRISPPLPLEVSVIPGEPGWLTSSRHAALQRFSEIGVPTIRDEDWRFTNLAPLTKAQLQTYIMAGDTLSLTGVPPGSGTRMGIDRNQDGVYDGDTPAPALQIAHSPGIVTLAWPYSAAGYSLETTTSLYLTWTPVIAPLTIVGGQNVVTLTNPNPIGFYRLQYPSY